MPLQSAQIQAAATKQRAAAYDQAQHVRLIAGPGTGKSFAIEERISWLLGRNVPAAQIYAVSFTRASARDLSDRVQRFCASRGQSNVAGVSVGTLHSLALRALRMAGLLSRYPANPLVLDNWELENVFDAEFGHRYGINKNRREQIRLEHEAFWSTGRWNPANYVSPTTPITQAERTNFSNFHGPRSQCYSCVLPGEIIGQCVVNAKSGMFNIVQLLQIEHLVVDEYQDLNPMDLRLVDFIAAQGAFVFVAGDDDQSIYSFRFASPAGIQNFTQLYPNCGQHTLEDCFRCTSNIVHTAQSLIHSHAQPSRIPKRLRSLYASANPALNGVVHRWRFGRGVQEAQALAKSCRDLIAAGLDPSDILVLISNKRVLLRPLIQALDGVRVAYEPPRAEGFLDSTVGRMALSIIRIVCDLEDYMAHRAFMGLISGIGVRTCNDIAELVIANSLNYRSIFDQPLPSGVFGGRALSAVNRVRTICSMLYSWTSNDTIGVRITDIESIIQSVLGPNHASSWNAYASGLPPGMTLEELRDYLWADTDEQQTALLTTVYERLNMPMTVSTLPSRVRVMTMHGAKGLSAKVVFVPGLEEEILPGPRRRPYPGLVLEAARLLYVSITRARACCVLSCAQSRVVYGQHETHTPSRFTANLTGQFSWRTAGLNGSEVHDILSAVSFL